MSRISREAQIGWVLGGLCVVMSCLGWADRLDEVERVRRGHVRAPAVAPVGSGR